MNIIQFSEGLQAKMKQELTALNTEQDEITNTGKLLTFIRNLISELKEFTRSYRFQSQAEEILFFKEVKPVFLSQYYYYKKIFTIRLFDSYKNAKGKQTNYYTLLQRLEKSVAKNLEFYEYCMSGNTHMDAYYFTRDSHNHQSPDRDEIFSTGYDTKLAKILANEMVKRLIFKLLNQTDTTQPVLTWTGSKTDLIELIYALQVAEVFNNGTADIKQIADAIQVVFDTSLGNYYRVFQQIRIRKSGQTNFLDQLKSKLAQKMDE